MQHRFLLKLFIAILVCFLTAISVKSAIAAAGIPHLINFQGKLVDGSGVNVPNSTPVSVIFSIYSVSSGGAAIWTETQSVTPVDGIFQVQLGAVTTLPGSIDFNSTPLYLGIKVSTEAAEMTPRVQFTAVPYAFNAEKVSGLTVTNTTGTLTIPNAKTISFAEAFTTSGANPLTLTTTGTTNVTLPTSGTLLSNTAVANQTITSTQSTGTVLGITDSTALSGAIKGLVVSLSGANAQDQTGLEFNLSNASGTNLNDIVGTASSWKVSKAGALTVASCTGCSAGAGYATIQEDGSGLTQRTTLNFIGAGVTCVDNAGATKTDCTIPSGGAGPWTDGAGLTYLTDTTESLALGATSIADFGTKLQVGSATNRGDIAVYGGIVKKGLTNQKTLANISDVFVYDTTRDSDGGRWTDAQVSRVLPWYTETKDDGPGDACAIATDDRCGQSSFPKKAIIASTADSIYVFDSDDNSMWMKFTQSGGTFALGADTNNNPSSVFALNGVLYVGTNGASGTGLYAFDFVTNRMYRYNTTNRVEADKDIANRNTAVTYATDARTAFALVDNLVNDVHASILSGSASILTNGGPLNGATFIAAATDAGISVVNLSSGKTLDYADVAADDYDAVFLTRRGRLYGLNETQAQVERWGAVITGGVGIDLDNADQTTPTKLWDENVSPARLFNAAVTFVNTAPDALEVVERGSFAEKNNAAGGGDIIYVGHSAGMTEIHDTNAANSATIQPWSKYYTTAYQTNYMPATIKAMFPLNETTGDVASQAVNSFALSLQPKGTPTYNTNGVHGTGVTFNGTNAFFCSDSNTNDGVCDNDTDYNVGLTAFHIQAWFKHSTTAAGTDVLINKMYNTTPARVAGWGIEMNATGNMVFGIRDDAAAGWGDSVTSTQAFNDNQWHHVVAVNTDTALCLYIDGKLAVACDVALAETLTLDGAATFLSIGADCSVGAACATGGNFWDGSIDDVQISAGGATTTDSITQDQIVRMYGEGRNAMPRRTAIVTDATSGSANTIADTGESWIVNEFAGSIVEITGGTGINQSRRVISNTASSLTVTPNWTVNPDTTSDFALDPERIHGTAARVTAIGSFDPVFIGESRRLFVGTNDGSDGGSVTVLEGMGTTSLTDIYHSDSEKFDDSSVEWTGTDRDDIQAIGANGRMVVLGSLAGTWTETASHRIEENFDKLNNQIASIRLEMIHDVLGANSHEIGGMGADLAEYYYSDNPFEAGELVAIDATKSASVKKTDKAYQKDVLGVVATQPGFILGTYEENSYPVALVGRVPVKVSTESGKIKAGDRLTSSSIPGVAMKATKAGRVLGTALEPYEAEDSSVGQILVFVNLVDYLGAPVELVMEEKNNVIPANAGIQLIDDSLSKQEQILAFLKQLKEDQASQSTGATSEIFTDRVTSQEIIGLEIYVDTLHAKKIKADSIEGLEIIVGQIATIDRDVNTITSESSNSAQVTPKLSSLDLSVFGNLYAKGGLVVIGPSEFKGNTVFEKLVTFLSNVIFKGKVTFEEVPMFNKDTAGTAIVTKDTEYVTITFDKEYSQTPLVTISITLDSADKNFAGKTKEEQSIAQEALENELLSYDLRYFVTKRDTKSFVIRLNKKAPLDVPFSWQAVAVKDVVAFRSKAPVVEPTIAPSITPSQEASPSASD